MPALFVFKTTCNSSVNLTPTIYDYTRQQPPAIVVGAVLDERNKNQRYQGVFTRDELCFRGFLKSKEWGLKTVA